MAPKKNVPSNGFMVFTFEWKSKYGKNMPIKEATEAAGKIWTTMNSTERAPYNAQAKEQKQNFAKAAKAEKLTCTGFPITQVEKEKEASESRERLMQRDIETRIKKSARKGLLEKQKYYFLMVNYFTKTYHGNLIIPAELSVAEFSLKNGISRKYHSFINPGVNIYGHLFEAQHHASTTHQLPLPPNAMGVTNLYKVYNEILTFIKDEETGEYPPVYTERENMFIVESALEFLKTDVGASNAQIKVYSIQYLFFILKEACCIQGEMTRPVNHYITDVHFERDYFEYQSGIACTFHEEKDRSKYCTQSYVTRWGYTFANYMCNDIAIELKPGRHVPSKEKLPGFVKPPAAEASFRIIPSSSELSLSSQSSSGCNAIFNLNSVKNESNKGDSKHFISCSSSNMDDDDDDDDGYENDDDYDDDDDDDDAAAAAEKIKIAAENSLRMQSVYNINKKYPLSCNEQLKIKHNDDQHFPPLGAKKRK